MRLALHYDRIHRAGAEFAAVSVDDDTRQAAMAQRWGFTHTRFVSDADGERILQPLGLFDPEERGGIALPGMILVDPDGAEVYRYQGRDFADRTNDDDILAALDKLDLPPVGPERWRPEVDVPADLDRFFRPDQFLPYFRGNRSAALAIGWRLAAALDGNAQAEARALAREHRHMAEASIEAWTQWREHLPE